MEDYTPKTEVQLTGDDLERARELWNKAQESMRQARSYLAELGALVTDTLDESGNVAMAEIAGPSATFDESSVVVCYYGPDGTCRGCWQDPPGICRPCGDTKPGPKSPAPIVLEM